jgi:hypothetical protein
VAYATRNGTALAGGDYTATAGTLQWADNDATPQTISVPLSNATPFSGTKSFEVVLSNPSDATSIADPGVATVDIFGDGSPQVGIVQLSASNYAVSQAAGSVTITVNRTGSSGAISVAYATTNGTAQAGTDYVATSGTLQWADGDGTSKAFSVPLSNATPFSGSKTLTVTLSGPGGGAALGTPSSSTVTISGAASPAVGSLRLSAASTTIAQNAGTVVITVQRTGGSSGAVNVAYATSNGTAMAGTDYTAASGTLSWTNGSATSQTLSIPISNSAPFAGSKTFTVALSHPGGGATISSPGTMTITIAGDGSSAVGSLQFPAASYTFAQSAGSVSVSVSRTGGSSGAIGVAYATSDQTAVAGTDYTATSGTLQWAAGDTGLKTLTVPVSNSSPFSGTRSFMLTLSAPTGGAKIGTPGSATVNITGTSSIQTAWVYYNGVFNWAGDWSANGAVPNYLDTAGGPLSGPYDIAVTLPAGTGGLWQPYINSDCQTNRSVCFDTSPYQHLVFSLKPTNPNSQFASNVHSSGDTADGIYISDISPYCSGGANPPINQWETCSIPLSAFALTDPMIVKFEIQATTSAETLFYLDNVGFTVN